MSTWRLSGVLADLTKLSMAEGVAPMWRNRTRLAVLIGFVLVIASASSIACTLTPYDSGYVTTSSSVQNDVIAYSTLRHNHWESGGTFTITGTAETGNSWSVGASAGYEATTSAEVKAALLATVTVEASVQVGVNGQLSGSETHTWSVSDTVDKQSCKCPVYKEWVDKPTETGKHEKGFYWDYCSTPENDNVLQITESASGTATGDHNNEAGVVSHYTYTQDDECKDCYGTGGDCPGGA